MKIIRYKVKGLGGGVWKGVGEWVGKEEGEVVWVEERKLEGEEYGGEGLDGLG